MSVHVVYAWKAISRSGTNVELRDDPGSQLILIRGYRVLREAEQCRDYINQHGNDLSSPSLERYEILRHANIQEIDVVQP